MWHNHALEVGTWAWKERDGEVDSKEELRSSVSRCPRSLRPFFFPSLARSLPPSLPSLILTEQTPPGRRFPLELRGVLYLTRGREPEVYRGWQEKRRTSGELDDETLISPSSPFCGRRSAAAASRKPSPLLPDPPSNDPRRRRPFLSPAHPPPPLPSFAPPRHRQNPKRKPPTRSAASPRRTASTSPSPSRSWKPAPCSSARTRTRA
jgi:hypothetical protein